MKPLLSITLFFLLNTASFSQDEKVTVLPEEVYVPIGKCYYYFLYDQVKLKNEQTTYTINIAIKDEADKYKMKEDAIPEYCEHKLGYEQEAKIVWSKNNIVSVFFSNTYYLDGSESGALNFSALNFDPRTGNKLSLHDLLNSDSLVLADTLIMKKFREEYANYAEEGTPDFFQKQITSVEFVLFKKGIKVLFRGEKLSDSMMEVYITFDEIKTYLKKESSLLSLCSQ